MLVKLSHQAGGHPSHEQSWSSCRRDRNTPAGQASHCPNSVSSSQLWQWNSLDWSSSWWRDQLCVQHPVFLFSVGLRTACGTLAFQPGSITTTSFRQCFHSFPHDGKRCTTTGDTRHTNNAERDINTSDNRDTTGLTRHTTGEQRHITGETMHNMGEEAHQHGGTKGTHLRA